jgi:polyribonucleotide nucleotidyltransferase
LKVLEIMKGYLSEPKTIKDTVPKILEFIIPQDAIGKVIGPKV